MSRCRSPWFVVLAAVVGIGCGGKGPPTKEGGPAPGPTGDERPSDAPAREEAKARLKKIGIALHAYHDVNQGWASTTGLSWRVHLLPYLEESKLYNEFKLNEAWDSE